MNGNRGAKGSIKDRLISMLYRLRYAKKVKKEDEYTIAKKEKQVDYLRNLVELKEKENVDVLDSRDKKALDKVNINVNFKIKGRDIALMQGDSSVIGNPRKTKKVGIDTVDLSLKSIELKTSELDTKVELKEEIKKTKNEVVILKEVETFIKKSKESLESINTEVDTLKRMSKDKNQDTKELEERYKKLREKVNKLKAQYDAIKDKYDLSEFSILESIKLIDNITDYKSRANLNEMDMMIKVCKKEIEKIDSVTIEYQETKKVGENIENIKEDQSKIKVKFHRDKNVIQKIKEVEDELDVELRKQEEVIDEMYKEASYFEKLARTELEYSGYGKMFGSLLKVAGGILTLPFTGTKIFGMALGNTMINRGLKTLNKGLDVKKKIVYDYKYTDIAYKISEVQDKVEYTNLILEDNLNEISKLKANLKKYKEYNNVLPEYESMISKIDQLENKLLEQQEKLSKMDRKLDEEKNLNKEKMKKVTMHKE